MCDILLHYDCLGSSWGLHPDKHTLLDMLLDVTFGLCPILHHLGVALDLAEDATHVSQAGNESSEGVCLGNCARNHASQRFFDRRDGVKNL